MIKKIYDFTINFFFLFLFIYLFLFFWGGIRRKKNLSPWVARGGVTTTDAPPPPSVGPQEVLGSHPKTVRSS
jgi:hypothetical protein